MLSDSRSHVIDKCSCSAVRRAARQISRFYDAHLEPAGLRITQYLILATVRELHCVPVSVLAERLDIERTAMGRMVALLERNALVVIRPSPSDSRSRIVALTQEGVRTAEKAAALWREAQRRFGELNGGTDGMRSLRERLEGLVVVSATTE
ncbi:MarR family winged helix-turn-helix transcriptional regulator [Bradyrhizobium sp. USDA 4011]